MSKNGHTYNNHSAASGDKKFFREIEKALFSRSEKNVYSGVFFQGYFREIRMRFFGLIVL